MRYIQVTTPTGAHSELWAVSFQHGELLTWAYISGQTLHMYLSMSNAILRICTQITGYLSGTYTRRHQLSPGNTLLGSWPEQGLGLTYSTNQNESGVN